MLQFVTDQKEAKMKTVLQYRTRHVTILMEDIFQTHNANAVVRSAECFGVQDLHIVEERYAFKIASTVAMGATKWMTFHRYKSTAQSFDALRAQGYRIIATTPHEKAQTLHQIPIDTKMALVFGTENIGLTQFALENADKYLYIPMYGFTQSFNVSVSVALCLQDIITRLHASKIHWQLTEDEKLNLMLEWARKSVRGSEFLEKKFLQEKSGSV